MNVNGYCDKIIRTMHLRRSCSTRVTRGMQRKAFLPYIKRMTDRIRKLLHRKKMKSVYKPTQSVQQNLRYKDTRDPLVQGRVCRFFCFCGQVYIGTIKRSVKTTSVNTGKTLAWSTREVSDCRIYFDA